METVGIFRVPLKGSIRITIKGYYGGCSKGAEIITNTILGVLLKGSLKGSIRDL